jgi:O-antigen/teichoic acid export membrane protein
LAKGASIVLVGRITGRGLHVVTQVVLARLLGPASFGLYAIGWTILRMLGLISPLGLDKGVIRFGSACWKSDPSRLKGVLYQSLGMSLLLGFFIGGGLFIAAPWIGRDVFHKPELVLVIRWFSPALMLYSGLKVAASATRVTQRMQYVIYTEGVAQPLVNLALIVLFYVLGWQLFGAVLAGVISFGIALLLAVFYLKRLYSAAISKDVKSTPVLKEMMTFSIPAAFAGAFTMFMVWTSRLMVGFYRPAEEIGIYQAASQSSILFAIVLSAFGAIFSPMISDLYHRHQLPRLNEVYRVSTKWGLYLSLPLFLTIVSAHRDLMIAVFGQAFATGWLPLIILASGQMVNVGTGGVGLILIMTGRQKYWLFISATMFVVNIVLNWLLIPRLGIAGAAVGTGGAIAGLYLWGLVKVKRSLAIFPYNRRYYKVLLATLATVICLVVVSQVSTAPPFLSLGLSIAISVGVFGIVLVLLGLDDEDKEFLRRIRKRLELV